MSKKDLINQLNDLTEYEDGTEQEERYIYVSRTNIKDGGFDPADVKEQEHIKPITEKGNLKAVHVPTTKYTLTQHKEAFERILEKLPESTTGGVNEYGAKATMKLFPNGSDVGSIGLWIVNSVDSNAAVRVDFFQKREDGDLHIPKDIQSEEISGYKRIHRGDWKREFEDFLEVINEVRKIWRTIVEDLDNTVATGEHIEEVKEIIGKKASGRLDDWLKNRRIDDYVEGNEKWKPTFWDLIIHGVKFISQRLESSSRVASEVTKEERIRKISSSLISHALEAQ